jgi:hypothetical protein
MLYHVKRNDQNYGPYTLEDLKAYVASKNVLLTDLAKSEDMTDWVPVSQVLGVAVPPAGLAPLATGDGSLQYPTTAVAYPDPPNLHWALVLLIGVFTCGLFSLVWIFVQAAWMRKVDPRSKALFYYIAGVVLYFVGLVVQVSMSIAARNGTIDQGIISAFSIVWMLAYCGIIIYANFNLRDSIEEHFNGPEPIGLSLSGVMTFFFNVFYFQYHFTRINELKRAARAGGTSI